MIKKLLLLTSLTISTSLWAEGLTLECKGMFSASVTVPTITSEGKSALSFMGSQNKSFSTVLFHFDEEEETGWIKIPLIMQPNSIARNKTKEPIKVLSLSINERLIEAKVKFKRTLVKATVLVDRATGIMEYSHASRGINFQADCSPFDETKRKF